LTVEAGQPERVADYPRPPRVEPSDERVRIVLGGEVIVDTTDAVRVLETFHPPVYYVPRSAFAAGVLRTDDGRRTFCEFKGHATYGTLEAGGRVAERSAWWYEEPMPGFEAIADHVAVYPGRVDACFVDDEQVRPQEGGFYGGWITSRVVGPFKGGPGTEGW
jgi:uncharacterized protein (DUF427 family)